MKQLHSTQSVVGPKHAEVSADRLVCVVHVQRVADASGTALFGRIPVVDVCRCADG